MTPVTWAMLSYFVDHAMKMTETAYRVIYLAARPQAVYVLHCFQKKTEKTSQHDIDLAKTRFKAIPKSPRK